jgi:hypothetical protein
MAFTPTAKTPGDLIRSTDWNDLVAETQRLETDKVNRAGADTLQGPLTINGNLGLGVSPGAKLDVGGNVRLRGGALLDGGGTARLSMPDNGDLHLYDAGGRSRLSIADNGRLDLKEDNGGVRISIGTNGAVGINRTDPSYNLDVNGSARVTSSLIVNGLNVGGQSVSPGAKSVAVRSGAIAHGSTIPLPAGFAQSQCGWLVGPRDLFPPQFDINENGANARFRVLCYSNSARRVTCQWYQLGHASTPGFRAHNGWANYIIIGVK